MDLQVIAYYLQIVRNSRRVGKNVVIYALQYVFLISEYNFPCIIDKSIAKGSDFTLVGWQTIS
jgi:hypothetical protein